MHGIHTDEIAKMEKYRHGYNYYVMNNFYHDEEFQNTMRAQRFGWWYAHSDWDDVKAAYREWTEE